MQELSSALHGRVAASVPFLRPDTLSLPELRVLHLGVPPSTDTLVVAHPAPSTTVARDQIVVGVWVPARTVRLRSVWVSPVLDRIEHVLGLRPIVEMVWVHAEPVAASVVDLMLRLMAVRQHPRPSVRRLSLAIHPEPSVPVALDATRPEPTPIGLDCLRPEVVRRVRSCHDRSH